MGVIVREAEIGKELAVIQQTFNANRDVASGPDRFRWLYHENPDGPARAWFAHDERTGTVAGLSAALPCRVRVKDGEDRVVGWIAADFSINRAFRSLGVALALRAAARRAIDGGASRFLLSHPNDRMLPVQLRAGCTPIGRMVRCAKPLQAPAGGRLGAWGLRLLGLDWALGRGGDIAVRPAAEPLGPEFDALFAEACARGGTMLVRDASYLDWRFRRCPGGGHEFLTSHRSGRLTGYVVFGTRNEIVHVKDWMAADARSWHQLFAGLIREAVRRDARAVSVIALETHPDLARLRRYGFHRRPDFTTAVAYAPASWSARETVTSAGAWYMTSGDRHG